MLNGIMLGAVGRDLGSVVLESVIYAGLAILILVILLLVAVKLTPFSIKKEIEEDQNTSLGIIIGAVILGVCYILGRTFGG